MSILNILLEMAFASCALYWLKRNMKSSLGHLSTAVRAKEDLLRSLEERLQYAQEFNTNIARSVALEAALYEASRELSKSVDTEEILEMFKERVSTIFNLAECAFYPAGHQEAVQGANMFKVFTAEKKMYFAAKDLAAGDRVKMLVMLNQLELFLKRAKLYQEIQELSITDGLTGVYVRRYFLERFKAEQLRSRQNNFPLSLLLIDVDNFKAYNDNYGHIAGDGVLKEVAKILKLSLRQIDMCGRYGGEEFCIMLPETSKEKAYAVSERIRLAMEKYRIKAFNEHLHCTISIGISSYPEDAGHITNLIDKADKALYVAKAKGKNRSCAFGIKC